MAGRPPSPSHRCAMGPSLSHEGRGMTRRVAIVGAGPAGCYAAERLAREADCAVDVIERLPTPFGLVRAGVAPDHQSTKAIARVLERALARPNVRFFGN